MSNSRAQRMPSRRTLIKEMAALALDEEQKTTDRIRALTYLADLRCKEEEKEQTLKKLDLLLERIDA